MCGWLLYIAGEVSAMCDYASCALKSILTRFISVVTHYVPCPSCRAVLDRPWTGTQFLSHWLCTERLPYLPPFHINTSQRTGQKVKNALLSKIAINPSDGGCLLYSASKQCSPVAAKHRNAFGTWFDSCRHLALGPSTSARQHEEVTWYNQWRLPVTWSKCPITAFSCLGHVNRHGCSQAFRPTTGTADSVHKWGEHGHERRKLGGSGGRPPGTSL